MKLVLTDWVLVRRMAVELEARLRGSRVRDVGVLPDGRPAVALWGRGTTRLLCLDLFGSPPLVTIEDGELPIASEPGFVRSLGAALRGTTLLSVKARRGDRLLRLTFGTRSRFGVGDEVDLLLELVPKFGNALLIKGGVVVSAAKEFSIAENPERAVQPGLAYEPPPPRERPPIAADADMALLESDDAMRGPVYVYRRDGRIAQVYVVPLAADGCERADSLLDVFHAFREERMGAGTRARTAARRRDLYKRLDRRERKLRDERASVDAKFAAARDREPLRSEGEAIYATLHELGAGAAEEAKERAAALFARYKKLGASLPHLETRQRTLDAQLEAVESLRWETDRARDEDLDDVEAAVEALDARARAGPAAHVKRRKRAPLEVRTESGSRILIGRTPAENAELTFHLARPNDLWFHAQRVPGAHVILQRDDRGEPPDDDIARAAELAAHHSKAQAGGSVPVDYTQRKHVRKQKDAPPGLVWYTNFKTVLAQPKSV